MSRRWRPHAWKFRPAEDAGYQVGYALAEDNLRLGRAVVADSVNPLELTRAAWRGAAERVGHDAVEVEVICSDAAEHRARIETRTSDIPGLRLPTWQDVQDREYHTWTRDRIVIDTSGQSIARGAETLLAQLPRRP